MKWLQSRRPGGGSPGPSAAQLGALLAFSSVTWMHKHLKKERKRKGKEMLLLRKPKSHYTQTKERGRDIFTHCLALCHTFIPKKRKRRDFSDESPDVTKMWNRSCPSALSGVVAPALVASQGRVSGRKPLMSNFLT